MNSANFTVLAGEAIAEWIKKHNQACILSQNNSDVSAERVPVGVYGPDNPLVITKFESTNGLKICRWNDIGTELMNLYNEENACRKHQKH